MCDKQRGLGSMTNYDWIVTNKKEIIEDSLINYLGKQKGKVGACDEICCNDCDFKRSSNNNQPCMKTAEKWLKTTKPEIIKAALEEY